MAGIRFATVQYEHVPLAQGPKGAHMSIGQVIDAELATRVNHGELIQEVTVLFDMAEGSDFNMLRELYESHGLADTGGQPHKPKRP